MKMIDEKRCLDSQRKCLTVKIDHYDANYQDARFAFVSKYGFIYSWTFWYFPRWEDWMVEVKTKSRDHQSPSDDEIESLVWHWMAIERIKPYNPNFGLI